MRVRLAALICTGLLVMCGQAHASGETDLKTTIWSEDKLWLLSASGQLFSIAKDDTTPRLEYAGDKVLGMCAKNGVVQVLVNTGDYPEIWQLRHSENGAWVDDLSMPGTNENYNDESKIDRFVSFACNVEGVEIVTEKRLLAVRDRTITTVALTENVGGMVAATASTIQYLYLGYDHGEWGGGLRAIDRKTGKVLRVENNTGLCEGLINTECDPVNGLVSSPWHSDCVIASIGLMHLSSTHGRIVEICGTTIRPLYFKNVVETAGSDTQPKNSSEPEAEGYETVAFYDLVLEGETVMAVGMDGLYRLHGNGQADFENFPNLNEVPPFAVNVEDQERALVKPGQSSHAGAAWLPPRLVKRD